MKALEAGLKNPYVIVVAALAVVVVGILSVTRLPADLLPQFKTPAVQIVTFYPGMAPELVEGDITSRLERWTGQSVGIEHQESKSILGVSIVKDFFRENISADTAMTQVTSYAMSDLYYLPPGTVPPMVMPFDPTASVPLCLVTVSSPTLSEKELYDVAYFELRNRLQSVQGVIAPAVYGGVLRRILAYVDRDKLEARNLSPTDVVRSLRAQNVLVPAGDAKFGNIDYQIVSNSMVPEVHELNDIPIKTSGNSVVFMRDVGEVKDSSQIQSNVVRINGRRQVYIPVYRQPGANTIAIVDQIKAQLEQIIARLRNLDPKNQDLVLSVVMDQSAGVRESIRGLEFEGGLGALLAGMMVLVFLRSLRATIIAVIVLPVTFLGAFIGLFSNGDSLNSMTLGGLALSVGIILDQAIVVLENIMRHMESGKPRAIAVLMGAREVALPVFVSVVTFAVAFFPVVFLTGIAKFLFTPLAVAVIIAIVVGFAVAMFLVPLTARVLLKESKAGGHDENQRGIGPWCERLVNQLVRAKYVVLGVSAVAFLGGVVLLTSLGRELFPPVDASQFVIYVRMPTGTRLEKTEATLADIERTLTKELGEPDTEYPAKEAHPDSDLRILISNAGVLYDWPAAYTPNEGPMDAFVLAQLKGRRGKPSTFAYVARLREKLTAEFPGVSFAFDTGGMLTAALNFGLPSPIDIQVQGNNLGVLGDIASEIRRVAAGVPGAVDVRVAQRNDYPQLHVEVDRIKAAQLGLTQDDVIKNVVTSLNSSIGFNPAFWIDEKNRNHYFLGAQYREQDIESIETLLNIPVTSAGGGSGGGRPTVLRNLVEVSQRQGPASVSHMNITRTFNVFANVLPGYDVGSVAAEIERRLVASDVLTPKARDSARGMVYDLKGPKYDGKGYILAIRGEAQSMRESLRAFSGGLVIAIVLIYLVMVALLRSFKVPLAVMLAVPLGLIGVAAMLYVTGSTLNIPSAMGILMMSGIVVQFSIILLMFAEQLIAEGADPKAAIARAVRLRVRPIMMTGLAACLAMAPMAIGGRGAEANAPLARAIIGGVIAATVLTVFVVPCLYVILKGRARVGSAAATPGVVP